MHKLNHFIFSVSVCLFLLELSIINLLLIFVFSVIFACLIDYAHHPLILKKLKLKKPWYHRRTWIQELGGFISLGLPSAFILNYLNPTFCILVIMPYLSHIFLDYLCIFPAYPLAPFFKIEKPEGYGIFVPRSEKWEKRIKAKKIRAISENYFLIINLVFLLATLIYKIF